MISIKDDFAVSADVVEFARVYLDLEFDDWQRRVVDSKARRIILNCSRQAGKSMLASILSLHIAYYTPGSLVLMVSKTQRQSSELFRVMMNFAEMIDPPTELEEDNRLSMTLKNKSRVVSLPAVPAHVRGFSAPNMIVVDEAARVPTAMYTALKPMLATTPKSLLMLISTPNLKEGFYFDIWDKNYGSRKSEWECIKITASQCPRISKEYLKGERESLGKAVYEREFFCKFQDAEEALFNVELINDVFIKDVPFQGTEDQIVGGLDLGRQADRSCLVILKAKNREKGKPLLHCDYIKIWPRGTTYLDVVSDVKMIADEYDNPPIGIDASGVGSAVCDLFDDAGVYVIKIVTTGGYQVGELEDGGYSVPKRELISKMDAAINSGRLSVWSELKESEQMKRQLIEFNVKLSTTGHEQFEARSGRHDDLVSALYFAVFTQEYGVVQIFFA